MFPQSEENLWRDLAVKYMTVIKVRYGFKEVFYCLLFAFIFFLFCFPVEDSRWYLGKCQSSQSREKWALSCQVLSPYQHQKGVVSKYEIKEIKEITKIKIYLESKNMTRKYIAAILKNLSLSYFFFPLLQINLWSFCTTINSSCESCGS